MFYNTFYLLGYKTCYARLGKLKNGRGDQFADSVSSRAHACADQGKSQSFTHNIADNVAPCSFSKIQLSSQNQGESQYGRNYKIKIPQYGYLRDIILKFTTRERAIPADVVSVAQSLYNFNYTSLEDIRVAGSSLDFVNPSTVTGTAQGPHHHGSRHCGSHMVQYAEYRAHNNSVGGYSTVVVDLAAANRLGNISRRNSIDCWVMICQVQRSTEVRMV